MRFQIIALGILLAIASCRSRTYDITKVELAKNSSILIYKDRPNEKGHAIMIDSSLTYSYFVRFDSTSRNYSGKVSSDFWETLNKKLDQLHYKNLDTSDRKTVEDGVYYELIIYAKSGKKHLVKYIDNENDPLIKTLNWLDESRKTIPLNLEKVPIKFETTWQGTN